MKKKILFPILFFLCFCLLFSGCDSGETKDESGKNQTGAVISSENDTEAQTTGKEPDKITTEAQTTEAAHVCSFSVVETVPATCTTDGYTKKACSCGQTTLTTEPAHGHSWVTTTETIHHDEIVEYVPYVVFSDGYEMVYTGMDAIDAYMKQCLANGYGVSYNMVEKWVVTQEAYDEVITTTTCSHCGCPQ